MDMRPPVCCRFCAERFARHLGQKWAREALANMRREITGARLAGYHAGCGRRVRRINVQDHVEWRCERCGPVDVSETSYKPARRLTPRPTR